MEHFYQGLEVAGGVAGAAFLVIAVMSVFDGIRSRRNTVEHQRSTINRLESESWKTRERVSELEKKEAWRCT